MYTEDREPQKLAHAGWAALGNFDLALHGAAALLFEIEAHRLKKGASTRERPSITNLGKDGRSGGGAYDRGQRGGGRVSA